MHTRRAVDSSYVVPPVWKGSERHPQLPLLPYHPIVHGEDAFSGSTSLREIGPSSRVVLSKSPTKSTSRSDGVKTIRGKINGVYISAKKSTSVKPVVSAVAGRGKPLATTLSDSGYVRKLKSPSYDSFSPQASPGFTGQMEKTLNVTMGLDRAALDLKDLTGTMMCRTISKKMLPPLVTILEQYVEREVGAMVDKNGTLNVENRLQPFRDVFSAFINAFPVYGKILNDIMSAYDRVIQEQSEALVNLTLERSERERKEREHEVVVSELNATITEMTTRVERQSNEISTEKAASPVFARENVALQRPAETSSDRDKKLLEATQKIKAMEEVSKADLEKLLVLINAVRESDKRAKSLELQISLLTSQVNELHEFKLMAADAQIQLENFKKKYQNFVSVQDHNLIKEYLTGELEAAQHMARQYRRSAAVRGTQVDVIGRKLKALQDENKQLLCTELEEQRKILTPRPDWKRIHGLLSDVKENADSIEALPLDGDEAITSTVPGQNETVLQVEYLVERIKSLSHELQRRSQVLMPIKPPNLPLVGRGLERHVPVHLRACGVIPRVHLDPVDVLVLVHDFFYDELQSHPDVLLHTLDVPKLYLEFLRDQIKTKTTLNGFACAEHLAINLDDMAREDERCRPSLRLLNGILLGAFPARIACDVITIIENVRSELRSLSDAQKRTRLRQTAISDCIAPVLQLKTAEEIALLRETLGSDTTHDVMTLCTTSGKFMSTLFDQECASGMTFYVDLLQKLTSSARYLVQDSADLVINLDDVGRTLTEVEPLTPKPVIKEILERPTDDTQETEAHTTRLDEVIHALAAAPVIRRTVRQKPEEAAL